MNRINWEKVSRVFSNKERIVVISLVLIIVVSLAVSLVAFYYHYTKAIPVTGGEYTEGIVGQPLYINPILSVSNDADADLCQLIYSGLFKYNSSGEIENDLAESYEISEDKLTYTVYLKKDIKWHDEEPFTAADVLFTIQTIQDPAFKSPLRQSWQGVGLEVVDDTTIRFMLKNPYTFFLNNLTVGILPKHIWESVTPANFTLAEYNIRPVGTGPYKFSNFENDAEGNILSYELAANELYYAEKPFIGKIKFEFYFSEESMIDAYNKKQIMGMSYISPVNLNELKSRRASRIDAINIPRYFAVFFNKQKSKVLADRYVRKALSLAVDRQAIINEVLSGEGKEVYSPIPPGVCGFTDEVKKFEFNIEKANKVLDDSKWKRGDDGFRKKDDQQLEFTLVTTDWPDLVDTAEILKEQWNQIGAKVEIETLGVADVQQNYIRPREYDALLFGQVLGIDPDPYAFWHSSQTRDPGLNLALYSNQEVDEILEEARQETESSVREKKYKKFQQILTDEIPALFLYSPNYLYVTNKKVYGIEIESVVTPDKRFAGISKWYVKTKRVKK